MKVITNSENIVYTLANDVDLVAYDEESQGFRVTKDKTTANGYLVYETNTVYPPDSIVSTCEYPLPDGINENPARYCFTEKDGFYKNPNWVRPKRQEAEELEEIQGVIETLLLTDITKGSRNFSTRGVSVISTFIANRIMDEKDKNGLDEATNKYEAYFVVNEKYLQYQPEVNEILMNEGYEECII